MTDPIVVNDDGTVMEPSFDPSGLSPGGLEVWRRQSKAARAYRESAMSSWESARGETRLERHKRHLERLIGAGILFVAFVTGFLLGYAVP